MRASRFSTAALSLALALWTAASCRPARTAAGPSGLDSDPVALLPPDAVVVASVDLRAVFADEALASGAAAIGHAVFPIGAQAGIDLSRDVDRLVLAEYGGANPDYVVVASGRFDVQKLGAIAKAPDGSAVASERYGGFSVHAAGAVSYAAVSGRTLLVGTPGGVRRALDRVAGSTRDRAVKPWISDTLAQGGAELAVAADFESAPVAATAIGPVDLSWVGGLRTARITGDLHAPGMNVAATLSYADAAQARHGVDGLRAAARWIKTLGPLVGGMTLQDMKIASRESDVECAFAVDDATLRALGALAPRFLPPRD